MPKKCGSSSIRKVFPIFLHWYAVTMVTHFPPLSKNVSHTSPHGQHVGKISLYLGKCFKNVEIAKSPVFSEFCRNMLLPWQRTFCHGRKMHLAHLHLKANISAKFHENRSKTEEVVHDTRFPPHFFAIICRYHGNTLPATVKKMCLAHLHPKANICAKFHENWWKTEEVVRDARFSPHFCHNMPLPWQHTFCHCQKKMCLAHLHPKANICAKFHENWWKTEEVVRDARFSPHFCHNMPLPWQHTFCHCQKKCVLHIYTPRQTSVPNFMRIGEKLRK